MPGWSPASKGDGNMGNKLIKAGRILQVFFKEDFFHWKKNFFTHFLYTERNQHFLYTEWNHLLSHPLCKVEGGRGKGSIGGRWPDFGGSPKADGNIRYLPQALRLFENQTLLLLIALQTAQILKFASKYRKRNGQRSFFLVMINNKKNVYSKLDLLAGNHIQGCKHTFLGVSHFEF